MILSNEDLKNEEEFSKTFNTFNGLIPTGLETNIIASEKLLRAGY